MQFNELINLAERNIDHSLLPKEVVEEAILIRLVEQKFLELFSKGMMNGTVHTCVEQNG